MMIWASVALLFLVFLFFIFDTFQKDRRRAKIAFYIGVDNLRAPSRFNRFFVRFGKEHRHELEKKLIEAGIYNTEWAKLYFPAKIFSLIASIGFVVFIDIAMNQKLIVGTITLIAVILVPDMLLELRRKSLARKISSQLPYLLEMMAVCTQAGMTVESALAYLGDELSGFDLNLSYQIKRTSESAKIHGLEKALNDLSERVPTNEVRSFVLTIIQNLQYGTSVAHILEALAEDMRKIQLLTTEEKVGKLSAKMGIPLILLILFPIVILILAPGIMQVMY